MSHMSEDQYKALQGDDDTPPALDAESAVAVDPGVNTGVAICYSNGDLQTKTTDFWTIAGGSQAESSTRITLLKDAVYIVEAPYITRWQKTQNSSAMAYKSGRVAREAELLVKGIRRMGWTVIEHDPHNDGGDWSGKWDSKLAHQIVGEWEGPDNEHTRDALKLLTLYGFAG